MPKYVNADVLLNKLQDEISEQDYPYVVEIINGMTECDAPVLRCKDCKYWQDNNNGYPHEECRWGHDETPDPDDYCSYGERKDDE